MTKLNRSISKDSYRTAPLYRKSAEAVLNARYNRQDSFESDDNRTVRSFKSCRSGAKRRVDNRSLPPSTKPSLNAKSWTSKWMFASLAVILVALGAGIAFKIKQISIERAMLSEPKYLFQKHATEAAEEISHQLQTTVDVFHGFGTSVQQIAEYTDQVWPMVTIPNWKERAAPILRYAKADSLILAPWVNPRQWHDFYDYTKHLKGETLHWRSHFQSLFVPWQRHDESATTGTRTESGSAAILSEWYDDVSAARTMDAIQTVRQSALLLRSHNATSDYLFRPIVADVVIKTGILRKDKTQKKVVAIVVGQIRMEAIVEEALKGRFTVPATLEDDDVKLVAAMEDNCGRIMSYIINISSKEHHQHQVTSTVLGTGDHHDTAYDAWGVVSHVVTFPEDSSGTASTGECYPNAMKISLYPTAQMEASLMKMRTDWTVYWMIALAIALYGFICSYGFYYAFEANRTAVQSFVKKSVPDNWQATVGGCWNDAMIKVWTGEENHLE